MSNLKTVKGIRKLVVFLNWNELNEVPSAEPRNN